MVEGFGADANGDGILDCGGTTIGSLSVGTTGTSGAIDVANLAAQGTPGFTDFSIGALEGPNIRLFREPSAVLGSALDVDVFVPAPSGSPFTAAGSSPFKIPAGSQVRSFLAHWDPVGGSGGATGSITFDTPIHSIVYLWHDLNPADALDNGTNTYYMGGVRGSTEFDTITISPDRMTITLNLFVLGYVDELRILFVDPAPQPKPADTDNDGLLNCVDTDNGGAPLAVPDTDGDGVRDLRDLDSDNDSVGDLIEGGSGGADLDDDGVVDGPDADGDGAQDSVDGGPGFGDAHSPAPPNQDGDAFADYRDVDADGDGANDITEAGNGALDTDNDGEVDSPADADGDGAADVVDLDDAAFGGLGVPAAIAAVDTDGDGVADSLDVDDDNDGILDVAEGFGDPDGDGVPNARDLDSDNDGINDVREGGITDCNFDEVVDNTDANGDGLVDGADADGDGYRDSVDVDEGGCPALAPDSDGDGTPDSSTSTATTTA